jgi:hypothetical protein
MIEPHWRFAEAQWVRALVAAFGVSYVATGAWALAAPRSWVRNYPGFGRHWIDAAAAHSLHTVGDGGAGFVAVGVGLVLAVAWWSRPTVQMATTLLAVHALLHFAFHLLHPDPDLATLDLVLGVWGLAAQGLVAVVLLVLASRSASAA